MRTSVDLHAVSKLLVLVADELDQFLVGEKALVYTNSERFRIGLWIFNRDVDLEMTEGRTPDAFREFHLLAIWTAIDIQPTVERAVFRSAQVVGLDHKRVAFPVSDRVAVPPWLRIALFRKCAAIHINVPDAVIGFVLDENELRCLNDLSRLRLLMELKETHRHAVGVRIILRLVHIESLFPDLGSPRCIRQSALYIASGLEERGDRWTVGVEREWSSRRFDYYAASAAAKCSIRITRFGCRSLSAVRRGCTAFG